VRASCRSRGRTRRGSAAAPAYEGWRTRLYGPVETTACPGSTSTVVRNALPSVAIAQPRAASPTHMTIRPATRKGSGIASDLTCDALAAARAIVAPIETPTSTRVSDRAPCRPAPAPARGHVCRARAEPSRRALGRTPRYPPSRTFRRPAARVTPVRCGRSCKPHLARAGCRGLPPAMRLGHSVAVPRAVVFVRIRSSPATAPGDARTGRTGAVAQPCA
jgi:hypothetical protein